VFAEFNDLAKDGGLDIGKGDFLGVIVITVFLHHGLDEFGHFSDLGRDGEGITFLGDL
jgi:hypothetical protein